jgi:hypothetical protein
MAVILVSLSVMVPSVTAIPKAEELFSQFCLTGGQPNGNLVLLAYEGTPQN